MSKKGVIQQTPERRTDMHFDEVDNTILFNTVQNVTPVLEENKRRMNAYDKKLTMGTRGEWHHAASIPVTIWERWMKETNGAIEKDSKLLARYVNDHDFKYFKVAPTNI